MHVLLTRPADDVPALSRELTARGFQVSACPMLTIKMVPPDGISPRGAEALARAAAYLFTSANGVRAARFHGLFKTPPAVPVFAVGPATAEACRHAGIETVIEAGGDVGSLVEAVRAGHDPSATGTLVHVSGRDQAGNLVGQLTDAGYDAAGVTLYRAEKINALPEDITAHLRAGRIDAVMFYSSRTAEHFAAKMKRAGLRPPGIAFCLSDAVAKIARSAGFKEVRVAAQTTQTHMLALLEDAVNKKEAK